MSSGDLTGECPQMRSGRRRALRVGLAVLGLSMFAAACSSEPEAAPPTLELTTTSVVITTTTSTTEAETTTTIDPRIAEVEAAVIGFIATFELVAIFEPESSLDQLDEFVGGELLDRLKSNMAKSRAEGRIFGGAFTLSDSPEIVEISDGLFAVTACGRDGVSETAADGSVIDEADDSAFVRVYDVEFSSNSPRVVDIGFLGGVRTPCAV